MTIAHPATGRRIGPRGIEHPGKQRPHPVDHQQDEGQRQHQGDGKRLERAARGGEGHHEGEQAPGSNVVDRRAGDRGGAHRGAGQAALLDHPRQNRKGGDAHRDAEKEGEGGERHVFWRKGPVEPDRQGDPEQEGENDRDMADRHRRMRLAAQERRVELDAHHEHEQQDAELAEQSQGGNRGGREKEGARPGRQPAEQRRTQEDTRGDLTDHRRLPQAFRQAATDPRRHHDDHQLQNQLRQRMLGMRHDLPENAPFMRRARRRRGIGQRWEPTCSMPTMARIENPTTRV